MGCSPQSGSLVLRLLYAGITYYFSSKMNRLLLLLGPTAAALGGIALAKTLRWALHQLTQPEEAPVPATQNEDARRGASGGEDK